MVIGSTLTTTTSTITAFAKRAQSSSGAQPSNDASASINSVCKDNSILISSICTYLLPPSSAPISTLTVDETSTYTSVFEYTTTSVEIVTDTVTATSYAIATQSIQPIINGGFTG